MPPARIVLVRRGEARAGVEHIIGGDNGCLGLTERGREQAAALRDRLARTGELVPDVIYTSTLRRAVETAEIVGGPLVDGPDVALSPGGESAREFDARVRTAVQRLLREHHDQILLVVSHGGFIGAACMYAVGAPGLADVYPFRLSPSNTSLSMLAPDASAPPWQLERYNDTAHLDADGMPTGGTS